MDEDRTRVLRQKSVDTFAFLVGVAGVLPKETYILDKAVFQIGQLSSLDLSLSPLFSSIYDNHARIIFDNDKEVFVLQQIASEAETFINGHRIEKQELKDNDLILLGNEVELIFKRAW